MVLQIGDQTTAVHILSDGNKFRKNNTSSTIYNIPCTRYIIVGISTVVHAFAEYYEYEYKVQHS